MSSITFLAGASRFKCRPFITGREMAPGAVVAGPAPDVEHPLRKNVVRSTRGACLPRSSGIRSAIAAARRHNRTQGETYGLQPLLCAVRLA